MANTYTSTGAGSSVVFGDSGMVYDWTSIDLGSQALPAVDVTNLASSSREKKPGDLVDAGSTTLNFIFDAGASDTAGTYAGVPTLGTTETVTITVNTDGNAGSDASYAGSAFIESVDLPTLEPDTLQEGTMIITWIAKPTWTDAT